MKTLITMSLLVLTSIASFSQEVAAVNTTNNEMSYQIERTTTPQKSLKQEHIQQVSSQVYTYLAKNLDFSQVINAQNPEAYILLEVAVLPSKKINDYRLIESNNDAFNRLIERAMSTYSQVYISDDQYVGPRRIQIPIRFSL